MDMTMLRAGMGTWLESKAPARPEEKLAVQKHNTLNYPGSKPDTRNSLKPENIEPVPVLTTLVLATITYLVL